MRTEGNSYPDDFPAIARDGWPYIALAAAAGVLFLLLGWRLPAVLMLAAALFVAWFFRDPKRLSPAAGGVLLSPADGTVLGVEPGGKDQELGETVILSIFMSVFNVHVNRVPLSGTVLAVRRHPGRFVSAFRKEAPEANERCEVVVEGPAGKVKFVQIAGLIARRIVCRLQAGDGTVSGQRYGLIKFGSRVDVHVPSAYQVTVGPGDRVRGALTVIGRLRENER